MPIAARLKRLRYRGEGGGGGGGGGGWEGLEQCNVMCNAIIYFELALQFKIA